MSIEFVTRKEWGAKPPTAITPLDTSAVRYFVVHYTAMDADEQADHRNCAARVRGIQRFHMDTREWSDIAYNWLVCKHGNIFRGRGLRRRSAATGDANGYTVAACFLGDDTIGRDDVTDAGRQALRELYLFVERNTPRHVVGRGHRDFMDTRCPGAELYAFARTLGVRS